MELWGFATGTTAAADGVQKSTLRGGTASSRYRTLTAVFHTVQLGLCFEKKNEVLEGSLWPLCAASASWCCPSRAQNVVSARSRQKGSRGRGSLRVP